MDERQDVLAVRPVGPVEDRVLRVPPVDSLVFPDERPEPVLRAKPVALEQGRPPGGPLQVVRRPARLAGYRGAEQHGRSELCDRSDQGDAGVPREVMRRLE